MSSPSSKDDDDGDDDDGKEKQPPKVRAELPYLFEKELTVNQNKRIYVVDEFIATERVTPIEGKFYSKRNGADIKRLAERRRHWELAEQRRIETRTNPEFPVLESQTYGWMQKRMGDDGGVALRQINCVRAPKRRCPLTVYGEKLSCERVTERPKFTGERFLLR